MSYDRNDRRFGGGTGADRNRDQDAGRSYGPNPPRSDYNDYRGQRFESHNDRGQGNQSRGDYGRDPRGGYDQDRGFFDRAGDEVRSWFGDEDAERRRRFDERMEERQDGRPDQRSRDGERFGAYGADRGATGNRDTNAGNTRNDHGRDPGYHSWRERQLSQFDQDYDEFRREHQQKFDSEFHSWRQVRQGQRDLLGKVQEHQEVVGSDGQHIGTVDHVRGDRIKLTKTDKDARGHHHSIPSSWIQSVDDKITISKTADQAKAHWRDEDRNEGGMFGGRDDDRGGILNRSFSGTY